MRISVGQTIGIEKNMTISDIKKKWTIAPYLIIEAFPEISKIFEQIELLQNAVTLALQSYNTAIDALNAAKLALGIGDVSSEPVAIAAKAVNIATDLLIEKINSLYIDI